jgi:hypothetical protein
MILDTSLKTPKPQNPKTPVLYTFNYKMRKLVLICLLVSYFSKAQSCFKSLEAFGLVSGEVMSDLTNLETINGGQITKDHRVSGIRICLNTNNRLSGIRLQISIRDGNNLSELFTLGSLGVDQTCSNSLNKWAVTSDITSVSIYYSPQAGVN